MTFIELAQAIEATAGAVKAAEAVLTQLKTDTANMKQRHVEELDAQQALVNRQAEIHKTLSTELSTLYEDMQTIITGKRPHKPEESGADMKRMILEGQKMRKQ